MVFIFAFVPTSPLTLNAQRVVKRYQKFTCALQPTDGPARPKFRRDADDPNVQPQTSLFPQSNSNKQSTPNDRVLAQVKETMQRLGVTEKEKQPPPTYSPVDISRVSPFSAFIGAIGAALISAATWNTLLWLVAFVNQHPFNDEIYVVQRLGVVVRTALVCLLALASGISGVTGIGLFLLSGRTTIGRLRGEFKSKS